MFDISLGNEFQPKDNWSFSKISAVTESHVFHLLPESWEQKGERKDERRKKRKEKKRRERKDRPDSKQLVRIFFLCVLVTCIMRNIYMIAFKI